MEQLKFVETLTVEEFKDLMNVKKISIVRNPNTQKLFMSFGTKTGAVSQAASLQEIAQDPVVSRVVADGEEFWMLHKNGSKNTELEL